jgi:hypothetical protein
VIFIVIFEGFFAAIIEYEFMPSLVESSLEIRIILASRFEVILIFIFSLEEGSTGGQISVISFEITFILGLDAVLSLIEHVVAI